MKRRNILRCAIKIALCSIAQIPSTAFVKGQPGIGLARKFIAKFKRRIHFQFSKDVGDLTSDFRPDQAALFSLKTELAIGSESVRENIVQLLGAVGLACDRPNPRLIRIIRDHDIIRALLIEAYARVDVAQYELAKILRNQCKPADLHAFSNLFLNSPHSGSANYLLLIAKAKTAEALSIVERIALLPAFRARENNVRIGRIARAALGNTGVEDEYLDAVLDAEKSAPSAPKNCFYDVRNARDGGAIALHLKELGWIGTRRSLLLACEYLRSPLKSYVVYVSERLIRDDALAAIRFNFPDERVLYQPGTVAEWSAVENFCTRNLAADFNGPTPDIPPARSYPLHSPGRISELR